MEVEVLNGCSDRFRVLLCGFVPALLYFYDVLRHPTDTDVLFALPLHRQLDPPLLQIAFDSLPQRPVGEVGQLLLLFYFMLLLFFFLCPIDFHVLLPHQMKVLVHFAMVLLQNFKGLPKLFILLFLNLQMHGAQMLPIIHLLLSLLMLFHPDFLILKMLYITLKLRVRAVIYPWMDDEKADM